MQRTADIDSSTRTIHTVYVTLPDGMTPEFTLTDDVEFVIQSRYGATAPKRLTYRDKSRLYGEVKTERKSR